MVAIRKKKYESGEGALYMTRKRALQYLQLNLRDFRKLCIYKGIYPREPRNRKRAQKGKTNIQTLYHKKDIQFLLHEPIIWKLRDIHVYARKINSAYGVKDFAKMKYHMRRFPNLSLDHIVKERYPTFIDALRDLDDCLTLCFLFSTFPVMKHVPRHQSALCRRLTVEFLHAVIEAKALRKVFISIKGYYYQIEFKGQTVTWITPHHFAFQPQDKAEVDFVIMSNFVDFYITMLGFVNFYMYNSLNLVYPPKLDQYESARKKKEIDNETCFVSERVSALNIPICKSSVNAEEEPEIDQFPSIEDGADLEEKREEMLKVEKLKTLFNGLKFFLNREVPREPLVFIIRSFGGLVSWDKNSFLGATFDENDESINYQIVDRPEMEKQYLSRYYVQPQWVFDCVNRRELLPVDKYLIGAVLPPHLSPFTNKYRNQVYVPPEEEAAKNPVAEKASEESSDNEFSEDEDSQVQGTSNAGFSKSATPENVEVDDSNGDDDDEDEEDEGKEKAKNKKIEKKSENKKTKGMGVKRGKLITDNPLEKLKQDRQEHRLRVKMIPKKHRKLYKSMMNGRRKRYQEISLLRRKRRYLDAMEKIAMKEKKASALKKTD